MPTLPALIARGEDRFRLDSWPDGVHIAQWEEHLWLYCGGDRLAPWCPGIEDLTVDAWEPAS